ncbi:UNVERIFIED_CONTAM: hypothetical protein Cloal_2251 [Acetivibrio alkalicellulosi]
MLKRKDFLSIITVGVILLLLWQTYTNTKNLQNQISHLQSELFGVRSQLSHEVSSITGTVQQMRDDARWWTPGKYEIKEISEEYSLIKVDWILNEYKKGSNVYLNYRQTDEDDFIQVEANDMGNGYFYAVFSTSVPAEPDWEVYLTRTTLEGGRSQVYYNTVALEEAKEIYYSSNKLMHEYFISIEHEGTLKTGELQNIYLSNISLDFFNPLYANINIGDNKIDLHLNEIQTQGNPKYKVQEVFLETRDHDNQVLINWELTQIDSSERNTFRLEARDINWERSNESLYLVVIYNDGFTSEREIKGF